MRKPIVAASFAAVALAACGEPAPVATAEAAPVETVTETVEVQVVPQSCLDAITAARDFAGANSAYADATADYPLYVGQAWEAGLTADVAAGEEILAQMEQANAEVLLVLADLEEITPRFIEAATACEAAAQQ